ncbi:MAG TPA: hypothetical protein V6D12_20965 [Candidatus Obscuribacterales bacterium]
MNDNGISSHPVPSLGAIAPRFSCLFIICDRFNPYSTTQTTTLGRRLLSIFSSSSKILELLASLHLYRTTCYDVAGASNKSVTGFASDLRTAIA